LSPSAMARTQTVAARACGGCEGSLQELLVAPPQAKREQLCKRACGVSCGRKRGEVRRLCRTAESERLMLGESGNAGAARSGWWDGF
jgi:NAD(P)H-nitrite reductase large subunit